MDGEENPGVTRWTFHRRTGTWGREVMPMARAVGVVLLAVLVVGCQGKSEMRQKFERIDAGMSLQQVEGVLGKGREIPASEVPALRGPRDPEVEMTGFPADAKWYVWG